MTVEIHDDRICELGEGPLWHPEREQLFWFDILGKRLMATENGAPQEWRFGRHVSAAGWVDRDRLLIASETGLLVFDRESGAEIPVAAIEADNPVTRSNDGRADPWGGFWIGTMGKNFEPYAGSIWRWYRGRLRRLFDRITVPNAICFSPDRQWAYFTDTWSRRVMRQTLGSDGWPKGDPELFLDLREDALNPDGAVVDAEGCFWVAQWGAARVARYSPDATFLSALEVPAQQASCPAFGGPDLSRLFVTSARTGLKDPGRDDGRTFSAEIGIKGQAEHRVIL
ncbi:SMP-30/gluconolactonase/LRE family protein [Jhaorihella thermophila]|uniref:Sugar lactone lactonase YvrE n=1 Tax=Jhaorihella thermophila TaxID=488547 RepID=A0A1H5ULC3_9RHOB|nr:SMP-30/gluconolactonase/LRE family protein [Jhaorihella thermophila]SEF75873.1 Sugar lactone lactonase YvrE [Jhaorihella thermophila]